METAEVYSRNCEGDRHPATVAAPPMSVSIGPRRPSSGRSARCRGAGSGAATNGRWSVSAIRPRAGGGE